MWNGQAPHGWQVQNLLQQMQGRFATMSDAIIGRSTPSSQPPCFARCEGALHAPKHVWNLWRSGPSYRYCPHAAR